MLLNLGFNSLTNIFGQFRFIGNDDINNLLGLENLENLGSDFFLSGNDNLTSVNQLTVNNRIVTQLDTFDVFNNPQLISLGGTASASFLQIDVRRYFRLRSNTALTEVSETINLANSNSSNPLSDIDIDNNNPVDIGRIGLFVQW